MSKDKIIDGVNPNDLAQPTDAAVTLAGLIAARIVTGSHMEFIRNAGYRNMEGTVRTDRSDALRILAAATGNWVKNESVFNKAYVQQPGVISVIQFHEMTSNIDAVFLPETAAAADFVALKKAWKDAFIGKRHRPQSGDPKDSGWKTILDNKLREAFSYNAGNAEKTAYRVDLFPDQLFDKIDAAQQESVSFLLVSWFLTEVYK